MSNSLSSCMSRTTSSSGKSWIRRTTTPAMVRNSCGRPAKATRDRFSKSASDGESISVQSMAYTRRKTGRYDMKKLDVGARADALKKLSHWKSVDGRDAISRSFKFKDFNEAF